ncbi:MAG: PepSY-like domain-containing protein [bacterium]|uniref:PepSY-like domain-containing protein n=1 Tax=Candidatus Aphodosoma intestinipullorum TaxID=2840674 RepID=A0A940DIH2_9BACT|nr:PepSY-like domain-containing protein [Candidatus Aphodosoma intestinipullorum]
MIKKLLFACALFAAFTTVSANERPIDASQLPAAAQTFIKSNFQNIEIAFVEEDVDFASTSYDVLMKDGSKIEFDGSGNWKEIDCEYTEVPAAVIPQGIVTYISAKHPGFKVVKIDRKRYGYEVELNNKLEIKFAHDCSVLGYDD